MEANQNLLHLKYIPIQENYVYAQFQMKVQEKPTTDGGQEGQPKQQNGTLILCLDKSGSMSGQPFSALQSGVKSFAKKIYEENVFEEFITLFYDHSIKDISEPTYDRYASRVEKMRADGGTNFAPVFEKILQVMKRSHNKDVSVVFFTDGQAGDPKPKLNSSFTAMKQEGTLLKSRFLCIGLSSSHDAKFLNQIAMGGSEMGNFFYIDFAEQGYLDKIQECLSSSLSMAMTASGSRVKLTNSAHNFSQNLTLEKMDSLEEEKTHEVEYQKSIVLEKKLLEGLMAELKGDEKSSEMVILVEEAENASEELVFKAKLMLFNQLIFQAIQEAQNNNGKQKALEDIKNIDNIVSDDYQGVLRMKNKILKRDYMEQMLQIKDQIREITEILRQNMNNLGNAQIAKLNDLAYRGVRQVGMQKKLDERSLKNQELFDKMENEVKDLVAKYKFEELKESHKTLVELVGSCPMSCNDTIEALQSTDCMGVCLEIEKTAAAIMDASKITIKNIVPTFMTVDSFLDSVIFQLGKANANPDPNFNVFSKKELAQGLGREKVNGLLPLFLFKEHWAVARRKLGPIFGFMCTNDIMGYVPSMQNILPFLVLSKALKMAKQEEAKEVHQSILKMVQETCVNMVQWNDSFRQKIAEQLRDFLEKPDKRTVDQVASIEVLMMYLYCLTKLENYQTLLAEHVDLSPDNVARIVRFAVEEQARRLEKADQNPMTEAEIFKFLCPNYQQLIAEALTQKKEEGKEEANDNLFAKYQALANSLRNKESLDEEMKEEAKKESGGLSDEDIIDQVVSSKPWLSLIAEAEGNSVPKGLIQRMSKAVNKHSTEVLLVAKELGLASPESKSVFDVAQIQSDSEVVLAILLQNKFHVKNSQRREAIENGKYVEIEGKEGASKYLGSLLRQQLKIQMAKSKGKEEKKLDSAKAVQKAKLFVQAQDIYVAGAILIQEAVYVGKGETTRIYEELTKSESAVPLAKEKLQMLQSGKIGERHFYVDKNIRGPKISHQKVFKLWQVMVRVKQAMSGDEFVEAFPQFESRIRIWNQCMDGQGYPTLNPEAYSAYVQAAKKKRKDEKLVNKVKKAEKMKL